VIDAVALQMVLGVLTGWLDRREREAIAYLIEENRVLRRQLGGRRLRLSDDGRRRLAALAYRLGRQAPREVATTAVPDTLLRWHRHVVARRWTYTKQETIRHGCPRQSANWSGGWLSRTPTWDTRDARCAQEPRASRRTVNDCTDSAGKRDPAGAGASDIVEDVPTGALE
jgi:hypothetical protein